MVPSNTMKANTSAVAVDERPSQCLTMRLIAECTKTDSSAGAAGAGGGGNTDERHALLYVLVLLQYMYSCCCRYWMYLCWTLT